MAPSSQESEPPGKPGRFRADVVGIFPTEKSIYRLVGALLIEQTDEWSIQRRYMTLETLAHVGENPTVSLPAVAS